MISMAASVGVAACGVPVAVRGCIRDARFTNFDGDAVMLQLCAYVRTYMAIDRLAEQTERGVLALNSLKN